MLQKCMLAGAMCAIAPGSPVQLLVALFVCLIYLLLVTHAKPFKGLLEDHLAFLVSLCLTVSLCFGFALITDDIEKPVFSIHAVGVALIFTNVLPFVYAIFATVKVLRYGESYMTEESGNRSTQARGRLSRNFTLDKINSAIYDRQAKDLVKVTQEHKEAHDLRMQNREARAKGRLKKRLTKRSSLKKSVRIVRESAHKVRGRGTVMTPRAPPLGSEIVLPAFERKAANIWKRPLLPAPAAEDTACADTAMDLNTVAEPSSRRVQKQGAKILPAPATTTRFPQQTNKAGSPQTAAE